MTIEDRIRYSKAKLRNIVYYRLEVEPTIEYRYRCQMLGIMRAFRKQVSEIVRDLDSKDPRRTWFIEVMNIINPKIKSDECLSTIIKLKNYVE